MHRPVKRGGGSQGATVGHELHADERTGRAYLPDLLVTVNGEPPAIRGNTGSGATRPAGR